MSSSNLSSQTRCPGNLSICPWSSFCRQKIPFLVSFQLSIPSSSNLSPLPLNPAVTSRKQQREIHRLLQFSRPSVQPWLYLRLGPIDLVRHDWLFHPALRWRRTWGLSMGTTAASANSFFLILVVCLFTIIVDSQIQSPPPPFPPPPPPSRQNNPPPPGLRPRKKARPHPPPPRLPQEHGMNPGKKLGVLFFCVALTLQIAVVVYLLYKRREYVERDEL